MITSINEFKKSLIKENSVYNYIQAVLTNYIIDENKIDENTVRNICYEIYKDDQKYNQDTVKNYDILEIIDLLVEYIMDNNLDVNQWIHDTFVLNKIVREFVDPNLTMNSDKEVKLKKYQDTLKEYNSNKTKFVGILLSTKPEQQEQIANKIINGNPYLGTAWKLAKIENEIKVNQDKINKKDISADEIKAAQTQMNLDKQNLTKQQQALTTQIATDLKTINENINLYNENIKQGKLYIEQNKISQDVFNKILDIDPSKNKKYVGWIAKQYIIKNFDINSLKSEIEEFDTLCNKDKSEIKDINLFKTLDEFKQYLEKLNNQSTASLKELETDYETILDNDDVLIICPNTHEASRKLGLTIFAHRNDGKDSAWCTTYKTNSHFNDYYFTNKNTFYYVKIKNENIIKKLGGDVYSILAFVISENGQKITCYDAEDTLLTSTKTNTIRKLLNI